MASIDLTLYFTQLKYISIIPILQYLLALFFVLLNSLFTFPISQYRSYTLFQYISISFILLLYQPSLSIDLTLYSNTFQSLSFSYYINHLSVSILHFILIHFNLYHSLTISTISQYRSYTLF